MECVIILKMIKHSIKFYLFWQHAVWEKKDKDVTLAMHVMGKCNFDLKQTLLADKLTNDGGR